MDVCHYGGEALLFCAANDYDLVLGNLLRQYWPTIDKRLRLVPEMASIP